MGTGVKIYIMMFCIGVYCLLLLVGAICDIYFFSTGYMNPFS